jgi:hypothetical protein
MRKMKSITNNLIVKMLIASLIVLLVNINVYARVFNNGAGGGFKEDGEKSASKEGEGTIEDFLIVGGGYYLNACSDIQKFLNMYEMQNENGIDYSEWQKVINSALANMNNAVDTYDRLIKKAEVTPYNETVIGWLMAFDYTGFMKKNGLNSVVFQQVAEFLKRGDITGLFGRVYSDLTEINEILSAIKEDVYISTIPEISMIWQINESCATLSLLGSYTSRVFQENL